jgi:hypothetical protein
MAARRRNSPRYWQALPPLVPARVADHGPARFRARIPYQPALDFDAGLGCVRPTVPCAVPGASLRVKRRRPSCRCSLRRSGSPALALLVPGLRNRGAAPLRRGRRASSGSETLAEVSSRASSTFAFVTLDLTASDARGVPARPMVFDPLAIPVYGRQQLSAFRLRRLGSRWIVKLIQSGEGTHPPASSTPSLSKTPPSSGSRSSQRRGGTVGGFRSGPTKPITCRRPWRVGGRGIGPARPSSGQRVNGRGRTPRTELARLRARRMAWDGDSSPEQGAADPYAIRNLRHGTQSDIRYPGPLLLRWRQGWPRFFRRRATRTSRGRSFL